MRVSKNILITAGIAVGAGALAVYGLVKDTELKDKAKESGRKMLGNAKELGGTLGEAIDKSKKSIVNFFDTNINKVEDKEDDYEDIMEDEDIKREFDKKEAVAEESKAVETAAEAEKTDKNEV